MRAVFVLFDFLPVTQLLRAIKVHAQSTRNHVWRLIAGHTRHYDTAAICYYPLWIVVSTNPYTNTTPYLPVVVISTLLASRETIKLTVVTREGVTDGILGLLEHALSLVTSLLRVRLHAVGLQRSHGAVHTARCLVLGLRSVRLAAVGLHGLGGFVCE
jgi:hypothetical protein